MKNLVRVLLLLITITMSGQILTPKKMPALDEFGDPTDGLHHYNIGWIEGTFSNSATAQDKLYVTIHVTEVGIVIAMKEYDKGSATISFTSPKRGELLIKSPQGKNKLTGNGTAIYRKYTDEEYIEYSNEKKGWSAKKALKYRENNPEKTLGNSYDILLDILRKGGEISMILYENKLSTVGNTVYRFTFNIEPNSMGW